jgi:hypothetical protein
MGLALTSSALSFPPKCGGVRSEHYAASMVTSAMLARASVGVL